MATKKKLERGQIEVETLKHFINGGTGIITIANTQTEKHVTLLFDVPEKKGEERDPASPIFVKLFGGEQGDDVRKKRAYKYFGCIWRKDGRTGQPHPPKFWFDERKAKGGIVRSDACVGTVAWLMRIAGGSQNLPAYMQLWHEGICCFCNLPLSQPESIKRGYGPKCAKDRGLPYGKQTKRAKKSERVETTKETREPRAKKTSTRTGEALEAETKRRLAEIKSDKPEPKQEVIANLDGFKWI